MSEPHRSGDPVEDLIRLAGGRPPVPAERTARVEAAVRARWKENVARRRRHRVRRQVVALAAGLAIAAGLGIWSLARRAPPVAGETVTLARSAWLRPSGPSGVAAPLAAGEPVRAGDEVATGEQGGVGLRMTSGSSVRLDAGTRVAILSASVLRLEAGTVYIDSNGAVEMAGNDRTPIEIHTPYGVVRDIGTQFEIRSRDGGIRVRVREGLVQLEGEAGSFRIPDGEQLEIERDGTVTRGTVSRHGPDWAWTEELAPMIDLEGRPALEFLEWVARERGLTLRFADDSLMETAARTTLSGSLAGLTLDEALQVVLPTCRMIHRVEQGALLVEAQPGEGA